MPRNKHTITTNNRGLDNDDKGVFQTSCREYWLYDSEHHLTYFQFLNKLTPFPYVYTGGVNSTSCAGDNQPPWQIKGTQIQYVVQTLSSYLVFQRKSLFYVELMASSTRAVLWTDDVFELHASSLTVSPTVTLTWIEQNKKRTEFKRGNVVRCGDSVLTH